MFKAILELRVPMINSCLSSSLTPNISNLSSIKTTNKEPNPVNNPPKIRLNYKNRGVNLALTRGELD